MDGWIIVHGSKRCIQNNRLIVQSLYLQLLICSHMKPVLVGSE